jgi:hypothetical protein
LFDAVHFEGDLQVRKLLGIGEGYRLFYPSRYLASRWSFVSHC